MKKQAKYCVFITDEPLEEYSKLCSLRPKSIIKNTQGEWFWDPHWSKNLMLSKGPSPICFYNKNLEKDHYYYDLVEVPKEVQAFIALQRIKGL